MDIYIFSMKHNNLLYKGPAEDALDQFLNREDKYPGKHVIRKATGQYLTLEELEDLISEPEEEEEKESLWTGFTPNPFKD